MGFGDAFDSFVDGVGDVARGAEQVVQQVAAPVYQAADAVVTGIETVAYSTGVAPGPLPGTVIPIAAPLPVMKDSAPAPVCVGGNTVASYWERAIRSAKDIEFLLAELPIPEALTSSGRSPSGLTNSPEFQLRGSSDRLSVTAREGIDLLLSYEDTLRRTAVDMRDTDQENADLLMGLANSLADFKSKNPEGAASGLPEGSSEASKNQMGDS